MIYLFVNFHVYVCILLTMFVNATSKPIPFSTFFKTTYIKLSEFIKNICKFKRMI